MSTKDIGGVIILPIIVLIAVYALVAWSAQEVRNNRNNPPMPTTIEILDLDEYGAEEYTPNSYD